MQAATARRVELRSGVTGFFRGEPTLHMEKMVWGIIIISLDICEDFFFAKHRHGLDLTPNPGNENFVTTRIKSYV